MIYNRLDGTSSKNFKIGKKGVELQDNQGKLVIQEHNGPARAVGISSIRLDTTNPNDIPSAGAVNEAIDLKVRTIEYINDLQVYQDVINDLNENDYIYLEKGGNE